MQDSNLDVSSSSSNGTDSFTTNDFIEKIKETIGLAREIIKNPSVKKNDKIQDLLKIQCCNTLKILTKLNQNDLNPNSRGADFTRLKFDDQQKIAKLIEIDDALIDKTIHYFETVNNVKEKKNTNPNLIQVQMNVNTEKNNSNIYIKDYRQPNKTNNNQIDQRLFQTFNAGSKRKYSGNDTSEPKNIKNFYFMAAQSVKRPQIVYKIKVDNAFSTPFIPKLTKKPNALKSLEESIKPTVESNIPSSKFLEKHGITYPTHSYPHPYQYEIENFIVPESFFQNSESLKPEELEKPSKNLDSKKFSFINQRNQLQSLVQILKNYKEIAVDLEHHSFRSYQGLTCLLQLSTDDCDYIIDVFPLWNDMEILNEIFTDPGILKIFHSSQFDIIWLQRDLGIYVVNMFDTWIASSTLNYQHLSLSSLVSKLCDYQLDKRFQLADWRMRPIPEEMLQYARCDTHFLLYIYRFLKRQLLQNSDKTGNLLRVVMDRSQKLCLIKYEKRLLDAQDHLSLLWKNNLRFNPKQITALKSLYIWRDIIARHEDESTGYVLPNNLLLKICEILPREQQGILACCNPIPPLVRQYINEIHKIILDARSRVSLDTSLETKITNQEQNFMTIDLTNDLMMDNYHHHHKSMKVTHHQDDNHHGSQEKHDEHDHHDDSNQIPLLKWSAEQNKFIKNSNKFINHQMDIEMDDDNNHLKQQSSSSSSLSLIDMFSENSKSKQHHDDTMGKGKTEISKHLFDGYITFYQRYLIKMKQIQEHSTKTMEKKTYD